MKFTIILVSFFIHFCDSNDFQCVHLTDTMELAEFYCENFNETLPANCSTTYLYSIGHNDKSKVTRLKIGGCDEEKIAKIIGDFRNIRSLDICCSNLRSLTPFDVTLEHLRTFNASHNQLTEDPSDIWTKMPHVMDVDLSHNNISYIPHYDLIDLPNLEIIDLSHNKLKKIDHVDIFGKLLKRDVVVHISWQNIANFKIEENIGKPIRVVLNQTEGIWPSSDGNRTEFHCREGSFKQIGLFKITDNHIENPSEMLRCLTPSLGQLILTGNFTEHLSSTSLEPFIDLWELAITGAQSLEFDFSSIKNPKHLYALDISSNNLEEIGNVSLLEQFSMINYFGATENQLKNVPQLIQHFRTKMIRLHLSGNHVGQLNTTTFEKFDVYELYLQNTNLSFDDLRPFESLKSLIKLDISYNNLEVTNFSAPSTALKALFYFSAAYCNITNASELIELLGPRIWFLDLSGNHIGTLNATKFEDFINLQTLNLSRTNLIEFDFSVLRHSRYYSEADFSHNNLKRVNITLASSNLGILFLNDNELTEVEPFTTFNFPKLWKLSISKNQITCTAMAELKRNWPDLKFVGNPFEQKHGDCSSVVGLMNNLGFVGTFISKWF